MAGTSDPAMRKSDWNAWAAGSGDVEVVRLERELAEAHARERRARHEAAETRDRFERLLNASRSLPARCRSGGGSSRRAVSTSQSSMPLMTYWLRPPTSRMPPRAS